MAVATEPAGTCSYATAATAADGGATGAPQQHAAQAAGQSCSLPPGAGWMPSRLDATQSDSAAEFCDAYDRAADGQQGCFRGDRIGGGQRHNRAYFVPHVHARESTAAHVRLEWPNQGMARQSMAKGNESAKSTYW